MSALAKCIIPPYGALNSTRLGWGTENVGVENAGMENSGAIMYGKPESRRDCSLYCMMTVDLLTHIR